MEVSHSGYESGVDEISDFTQNPWYSPCWRYKQECQASHEAHRHGSHLRVVLDGTNLRRAADGDALVFVEGQADDAKLSHLSLAARL